MRKSIFLIFSFFVLLAISVPGHRSAFGDEEQSNTREPLFVSLWAEDPILGMEKTVKEARMLQAHLNEYLKGSLAGSGFGAVQVEVFSTFRAVLNAIKNGRHQLIECDPGVIFASADTPGGQLPPRSLYEPVLQFTRTRTGIILSMRSGGMRSLSDLNGSTVAAVAPYSSAGGVSQNNFLLNSGITPGLDFEIHYSGYPSEAVKMLVSNWVDAVLVPQGTEEELWEHQGLDRALLEQFTHLAEVGPVLGNVFILRKQTEETCLGIGDALVRGVSAYYGEEVERTKGSYYITLETMVEQNLLLER